MIGYSTAKDRKTAIKPFKDQIKSLSVHQFAYQAIMKLLTTVDDTVYIYFIQKLLQKTILTEMNKDMKEIMLSEYVLLLLLLGFTNYTSIIITKYIIIYNQIIKNIYQKI